MGKNHSSDGYDFVRYCIELDDILNEFKISCDSNIDELQIQDILDLKMMDEHNLFTYGMESEIDFDMLLLKSREFKRKAKRV